MSDRDTLLLQEFYPDVPVDDLAGIYVEIVPDPLRVLLIFRGVDKQNNEIELYRVFLGPKTFFRFLEMQLEAGYDLKRMLDSSEK